MAFIYYPKLLSGSTDSVYLENFIQGAKHVYNVNV